MRIYNSFLFKITTIFQRTQSNHNMIWYFAVSGSVQNYHDFSKNAIKSQQLGYRVIEQLSSKLPRFFKERNQITTECQNRIKNNLFKITTIFQRTQSNHNAEPSSDLEPIVQNYHDFSKNAIKSQLQAHTRLHMLSSKLPRFFKECNQITTSKPLHPHKNAFKITTIIQRIRSNPKYRIGIYKVHKTPRGRLRRPLGILRVVLMEFTFRISLKH